MKNILIITTGQPSTNPRMIKEYISFKEKGFNVKVIYSYWTDWALEKDSEYFKNNNLIAEDFILAGGTPYKKKFIYFFTRLFYKFFASVALQIPIFTQWAIARSSLALYFKAISVESDLYIAHNLGALPAASLAAKRNNAKVGFDAEDFHRGEFENKLSKQYLYTVYIENKFLPFTDYTTAASPLIAEAYIRLYPGLNINVIHNVFSKQYLQSIKSDNTKPLKLFWFSQTIGPKRGLETVIKAMELKKNVISIDLFLAGNISSNYKMKLLSQTILKNNIHFLGTFVPEEIFSVSSKYDIGLATEVANSDNRNFCLTNKLFTYLLAGNCIIATNTEAQRDFFLKNPSVGFIYNDNSPEELASLLIRLNADRKLLLNRKTASIKLASKIYNWENEERTFSEVITKTLKSFF